MDSQNPSNNKLRIAIYVLIILVLVASGFAIYFGVKANNDGNNKQTSENNTSSIESESQLEEDVSSVDNSSSSTNALSIDESNAKLEAALASEGYTYTKITQKEKAGYQNKYDLVEYNLSSGSSSMARIYYRVSGVGEWKKALEGQSAPNCQDYASSSQELKEAIFDRSCYGSGEAPTYFGEYFGIK